MQHKEKILSIKKSEKQITLNIFRLTFSPFSKQQKCESRINL